MELFAFFIIAIALFVWGFLFLIECGIAMIAPWMSRFGGREVFVRYLQPVWETTNVFLVFALVALIAFFPDALPVWAPALVIPFFFFLAAMGIRSVGMLLVFYRGGRSRSGAWILALGGFLAPAIFASAIFPYFLFGTGLLTADSWPLAAALGGVAVSLAVFFAVTLFHALKKHHAAGDDSSHVPVIQASFCAFAFAAAACEVFGPGVAIRMPFIGVWYLVPLTIILIADLGAVMLVRRRDLPRIIPFAFGAITFGFLSIGAFLAQMPYLIYGSVTIYDAFTTSGVARILFIALGFGALMIIPALMLLFAVQGRQSKVEE